MHICQDEILILMSLLGGGGAAIRWLRAKWHQRRCQHKCTCSNNAETSAEASSVCESQQVEQI